MEEKQSKKEIYIAIFSKIKENLFKKKKNYKNNAYIN
jgi:hypothetical protein